MEELIDFKEQNSKSWRKGKDFEKLIKQLERVDRFEGKPQRVDK